MGDQRNKIMKIERAEADRRGMAALLASLGPPGRPPATPASLKFAGCGLDEKDRSKPDGTFIQLYSIPGDRWWKYNRIYCEHCLERLTGEKPYDL
jgi:hypothetical protein